MSSIELEVVIAGPEQEAHRRCKGDGVQQPGRVQPGAVWSAPGQHAHQVTLPHSRPVSPSHSCLPACTAWSDK